MFKKLGTYILEYDGKYKYYEVSYGQYNLQSGEFFLDILLNEVTELKIAERNYSETKVKQKVLSKIAHEFKTPIIMIINLLSEISFNLKNKKYDNCEEICLHSIKLSEYITFLINDVIFYASGVEIKIEEEEIVIF
jgi:hypothetical protein